MMTYIQSTFRWVRPDHFKQSEISPNFKGGNENNIENYIPIALISNVAKVFERLLHKRIYKFLEKCEIISEKQLVSLRKKEPMMLQHQYVSTYIKNFASSTPMAVAFLDFSKAFDTVNYNILFRKSYRIGIRGHSLNIINSYLKDRKQTVKVNNEKGKTTKVNIGLPQGSILGP